MTSKYCLELVRHNDYNHFMTTLFQPSPRVRQCLFAIRALNVEVARIQDSVKEPAIAAIRFQWWKDVLGETFRGRPAEHPVSKELAISLEENSLSKLWFTKLINEREKHLQRTTFQSLEQLEQYAEQTVSSILYLHLESLRVRNANIEHACGHLGKAIGIMTILRSVPHSLPSVFIPSEILIKHKLSTQELLRSVASIQDGSASISPNLKDAVFEVATRANDQLLTAGSFLEKEELDQSGAVAALLPMKEPPSSIRHLEGFEKFFQVAFRLKTNMTANIVEEEIICRVCRSSSSPTQSLFHPCKCSGSMKYIHQSCLEQWLKHSGKKSCDICNHVYSFTPIYSASAPERLGIITALYIIAKRVLKNIGLYSRIVLASFCWLIWVPYVTAWTWRLFLNPTSVLEEQPVVSMAANEPKFTRFLQSSYFAIDHEQADFTIFVILESLEISANWPLLIKSFFSDVFEGQIICAVVMMIILILLLIREYVLANEQQPPIIDEPILNIGPVANNVPPVDLAPVAEMPADPAIVHVHLPFEDALKREEERLHYDSSMEGSGKKESPSSTSSINSYYLRSRKNKGKEPLVDYFDTMDGADTTLPPRYPTVDTTTAPTQASRKGKAVLILDDELEADLNESLPLLDYSLQPSPIIPDQEEISRRLMQDVERMLEEEQGQQEPHLNEHAEEEVPAVVPIQQEEPIEEPDLNMVVNVGIEDGEIVAQVEVNDVHAFLDLVGVQGSITKLVQSISLAHLIIMLILGIGVWIPYLIGNFSVFMLFDIVVPSVLVSLRKLIKSIQRLSDPFVDPIVDGILAFVNISNIQNATQAFNATSAIPISNSTWISFLLVDLHGEVEASVQYGPYHANFFQSFKEDLFIVFVGYSVVATSILLYSSRVTGHIENPYMQAITRFAQSINSQLLSAIKIILFVVLELACFPFYCGVLIDLCTLPVLSDHSSIASRYALFLGYPWLFCFLHWIIGSTFMFQLAMYVATIREMFRPGVLWFLKDPNDPNFNAMRELLRRSLSGLVRKLITGIFLYGSIIIGVIGGGIQLILLLDYTSTFFFGTATIFKVLPLRLEYYDTLAEVPFDLFFFHYILPQAIRFMKPDAKFRNLVSAWFSWIARALRITHFLLGKEKMDEQSDHEDEEEELSSEILPFGQSNIVNHHSHLFEQPPVSANLERESKEGLSSRREKRYMRVPNHDNIEIVPKEKLLIRMKEEDPVFGRAGETDDEIKANWTKVYVPDNFYTRLWFLVFLHLLTFICLVPLVLALPVVCGRVFFVFAEWYLASTISVPEEFNFSNPILSDRKELPTHDFYSFFAGICVLFISSQIVNLLYRLVKMSLRRLHRRNAIKRSRNGVRAPVSITLAERFRLFWHRKGRYYTLLAARFLYLTMVTGILIPLLVGVIFDIYVVTPIQGTLGKTPIVFFILDWSTGAMALRIAYNIIAMVPDRRVARLMNEANAAGLARMNLLQLTEEIFLPIIFTCVVLLVTPLVSKILDFHFSLPSNFFNQLVIENGALATIALYVGFNVFSNTFTSLQNWFEHLKDDQYLVGRTLQNIE